MLDFFINLLFPINCIGCGHEKKLICYNCLNKIPLTNKHYTILKKSNIKLITASYYNNIIIRQAIFKYKYSFVKNLSQPLSDLLIKKIMSKGVLQYALTKNNSILIPVPLHKKRLRWRGFNQSELLAKLISKKLNINFNNNLLIRTKNTSPQMEIHDAIQRQKNIQDAFSISDLDLQQLQNKTIILVDDVCTTGATLKQCAQVLEPLKPKQIYDLVIARG